MEFIKDGFLTFNYEKCNVTVTERKHPVHKPTYPVTSSDAAAMDPYDEHHIDEDDVRGKQQTSVNREIKMNFLTSIACFACNSFFVFMSAKPKKSKTMCRF